MVKKLAAVMLAAAVTAVPVFAETIGVISDGESMTVVTKDKEKLILNGYNENGALISSRIFFSRDGIFNIPNDTAAHRLRAYFADGGEVYDVAVTRGPEQTPEASAEPEITEKPEPTQSPESEKEPSVSRTYPAVYERQKDAVEAIAVVSGVSQGENDSSEPCYYVDVLYQGEEMRLEIKEDVTVTEASDAFSYMEGESMSALAKGDVICVSANLSGEIKTVGFVYRPSDTNIATDGSDYGSSFERLISANGSVADRSGWSVMTYGGRNSAKYQLAFGVISDKQGKSLTLTGADGDENKALDLSLDEDTIVYVCDMSNRKELSIKKIGGIEKSSIPKSARNDSGYITYSNDFKMNYALVRVVDDTVTDAVIYTNYNR